MPAARALKPVTIAAERKAHLTMLGSAPACAHAELQKQTKRKIALNLKIFHTRLPTSFITTSQIL
jgi:hypothetical protein